MPIVLRANTVRIPDQNLVVGTGWLPPNYDQKDYTEEHPAVAPLAARLKVPAAKATLKAGLPAKVDLRPHCSPIENQQSLGSCTANAAVGVVEYFERRAFQKHLDGSRLFVYKNTRNLMGVTGDTGAWLRNTMGALVLCGVTAEKYWPYTDVDPDFDRDPSPFAYSVADDFRALKYFCHDPLGKNVAPADVLASIKKYLAAGIPSMFGFWGYASSFSSDVVGGFPLPGPSEDIEWGHAVVAVGYDDTVKIKNTTHNVTSSAGAFLIRNSWGTAWGNAGYGWIPYDYVSKKIAMDFWSLLSLGWVDTGVFHF
jgi:C1A family cysteine protease